jgi:hypothetical protein
MRRRSIRRALAPVIQQFLFDILERQKDIRWQVDKFNRRVMLVCP